MSKLIQNSFTGGVITESLFGRTDTEIYYKSAKNIENFIVRPYGGISSRAGFKSLIDIDTAGVAKARVVPYVYNAFLSYFILFYKQNIYVYSSDGRLVYNNTTVYDTRDIMGLKYRQIGKVLYFCDSNVEHGVNKPVYKLTFDGSAWAWVKVSFIIPDFDTRCTIPALDFGSSEVGIYTYSYRITCFNGNTGKETLSELKEIDLKPALDLVEKNFVKFEFKITAADIDKFIEDYTGLIIYKKDNGVYGYLAYYPIVKADVTPVGGVYTYTFNDTGAHTVSPGERVSPKPFLDFSDTDGYPSSVSFFQQRTVWANTPKNNRSIWFSKLGDLENLTYTFPVVDTSGIRLLMEHDVMNLVEINKLLCLTDTAEIKIDASSGLSAYDIKVSKQSYYGCSALQPLIIGNMLIYCNIANNSVRDLTYDYTVDGYKGVDLSVYVPQFFYKNKIVEWSYQQNPYSVIWSVLDNGDILGLTYNIEQKVLAWHKHTTGGKFISCCVLKVMGKEKLYVVVERNGRLYVEVMGEDIFQTNDVFGSHYLDGYKVYDGFSQSIGGGLNPKIEATARSGTGVTISADNFIFNDVYIGKRIVFYEENVNPKKLIGIAEIVSVSGGGLECEVDFILDIDGTGSYISNRGWWAIQDNRTPEFANIQGNVRVVGDGDDLGELELGIDKRVLLEDYYSYIVAGFSYESLLETLDLNVAKSDIMFNLKSVPIVYLKVEKSREFQVGEYTNNQVYKYYDVTPDNIERIQKLNIDTSWDRVSNIVIKRTSPFALNINCLMLEFKVGG